MPLDQNPRQLARKQALALEMFERLQNQAREVTRVGAAVEADASFRSLAGYRSLRQKVTEFESFCSVIEALIAELPGDSRENVELKFYKLWFTIFRPSLKAFGAFFQRVAGGNQIPFGIGNLLVSELNALEEMREVLQKPRFAGFDDSGLLADLDSLIGLVKTLRDRSTNLAEFAQLQPA